MSAIKIKTPAKINLTLDIIRKRSDGFHEINSVMQAVSLYDFISIEVLQNKNNLNLIYLNGNNSQIPYDSKNLVYKAIEQYLQKAEIKGTIINAYIEKHIPVAAGLAGGSSNAAGALLGLNHLFDNRLNNDEIHNIAKSMGSDLNFCMDGATQIASSRGELLEKIPSMPLKFVLIKPKNLLISAKEAYEKFSFLENKSFKANTAKMKKALSEKDLSSVSNFMSNHLEEAILPFYPEILDIKKFLSQKGCLNTLMSGSGPTVFGLLDKTIDLSGKKSDWECFVVDSLTNGVILEQFGH